MRVATSLRVTTLTLLVLAAHASYAEESDTLSRPGPYVGVTFVASSYLTIADELSDATDGLFFTPPFPPLGPGGVPNPPDPASTDIEFNAALGFDAYVGYRLNRYVAIEAEVEYLANTNFEFEIPDVEIVDDGFNQSNFEEDDGPFAQDILDVETITSTVNAKFFWPLGRLEPFVLFGVGLINVEADGGSDFEDLDLDVSATEVAGRIGGGADFLVTKNVVLHLTAEYVIPGGSLEDFDYVSYGVGLQYRF